MLANQSIGWRDWQWELWLIFIFLKWMQEIQNEAFMLTNPCKLLWLSASNKFSHAYRSQTRASWFMELNEV